MKAKIKNTKENQYKNLFIVEKKYGRSKFGLMSNQSWNEDPKRTLFTMSRYKFVAKMFDGRNTCLEIGCADAFGTRLVQQTVKKVTVTDFDQVFLDDISKRQNKFWPLKIKKHDFVLDGPMKEKFDCAFALDVFEHIKKKNSKKFLLNIKNSLKENGELILGIPSKESQKYASQASKLGHVNCMSGNVFRSQCKKYFKNVFVFSMNDEVLHTGFFPMSNYLFAICCK